MILLIYFITMIGIVYHILIIEKEYVFYCIYNNSNMNKFLTIIIPTYNMEKYLRRCLDSLIIDEEGMKQLEVLVINDGSKTENKIGLIL